MTNPPDPCNQQDWLDAGYPSYIAVHISALNRDLCEEGDADGMLTFERAEQQGTTSLLRQAMEWDGIVGFTTDIVEAVRTLDKMKGASA